MITWIDIKSMALSVFSYLAFVVFMTVGIMALAYYTDKAFVYLGL